MTTTALPARGRALAYVLLGVAVAVSLGVFGRVHDPTGQALPTLFFTATINLKVWFATAAVSLALFQGWSALRLFGRIGGSPPTPRLGRAHRISGRLAFLFTLPVAYHCLWALGFQSHEPRVLLHSLVGSLFFGALVAKVLVVRSKGMPGWLLPWLGGTVFTALVAVWFTSSLWFFTTVAFPGL